MTKNAFRIGGSLLLSLGFISLALAQGAGVSGSANADLTVCTADAMQCPDGSWVGRSGPNCQFVCPGPDDTVTSPPSSQPPSDSPATNYPGIEHPGGSSVDTNVGGEGEVNVGESWIRVFFRSLVSFSWLPW
jgi:hypothetical protein